MERVAEPFNAARRQNHRDNVKTHVRPLHAGAPGVVAGGTREVLPLVGVHGAIGFAEFGGAAGFHFHEDQFFLVPDHQVDLAVSRRGTIVSGDDGAATAAEVAVREVFSQPSMIGSQGTAAKGVRGAVDQTEHLLKDLKLELHHLAAYHVAQVILPEFAVARKTIYQEFEAQPPPESK